MPSPLRGASIPADVRSKRSRRSQAAATDGGCMWCMKEIGDGGMGAENPQHLLARRHPHHPHDVRTRRQRHDARGAQIGVIRGERRQRERGDGIAFGERRVWHRSSGQHADDGAPFPFRQRLPDGDGMLRRRRQQRQERRAAVMRLKGMRQAARHHRVVLRQGSQRTCERRIVGQRQRRADLIVARQRIRHRQERIAMRLQRVRQRVRCIRRIRCRPARQHGQRRDGRLQRKGIQTVKRPTQCIPMRRLRQTRNERVAIGHEGGAGVVGQQRENRRQVVPCSSVQRSPQRSGRESTRRPP